MYVIGHNYTSQVYGAPEIAFDIVGSTGNIYRTVINRTPTCSCPDSLKGNQCKHICYGKLSSCGMSYGRTHKASIALVMALKAPEELQYQAAFLSHVSRSLVLLCL